MERGVLDPGNGMGVAFGDYDNDGDLDLHVTNMSSTAGNRILSRMYPDADPEELVLKKLAAGNSLFANDGSGTSTTLPTMSVACPPAGLLAVVSSISTTTVGKIYIVQTASSRAKLWRTREACFGATSWRRTPKPRRPATTSIATIT